MSTTVSLLFVLAIGVTHSRVTFTHSEVLQQTDLGADNTAPFKCENGCYLYSDSVSEDMWVNDGVKDVQNFLVMGAPDKASGPAELVPSKDYKLVYRGEKTPPSFVFYAVDKKSPNLDTPVHAFNNADILISDSSQTKRFTLLNSLYPPPQIVFKGDFAPGYPRIYATGFDATSEDACKPVYQARSQESAQNSVFTIPSAVVTVDNGPAAGKANVQHQQRMSGAFTNKAPNSSVVYMSPGYVGCSYIHDQSYSNSVNTVLDNFSAEVKSLDFSASLNVPTEVEAVHITVNNQKVDLFGVPSMEKHYDADRFDVTISWIRNTAGSTSSFAVQFDLGIDKNGNEEMKSTTTVKMTTTTRGIEEESTTSTGNRGILTLSSLLTVAYIVLGR